MKATITVTWVAEATIEIPSHITEVEINDWVAEHIGDMNVDKNDAEWADTEVTYNK